MRKDVLMISSRLFESVSLSGTSQTIDRYSLNLVWTFCYRSRTTFVFSKLLPITGSQNLVWIKILESMHS